jgi:ABC-type phosphate transport system substrate-binding protein
MLSIFLKAYVGASPVRICVAAMAIALVGTLSSAAADPITIQGSTTFNRRLMEPHQEEIEAISGQQLAMISAPLEAEIELLQKVMPGLSFDHLHAFEIARTRVSFAVNRNNPVRTATLEQIADIMLGKIDNWSALQGPDLPIRVVLVGGGGGLTAAVESGILNGEPVAAPNMLYVHTPVQLIQIVNQDRGAIGFAQLALVEKTNTPELKTDRPFEQVLYLVTFGEPTAAARSVIDAARTVAARNF